MSLTGATIRAALNAVGAPLNRLVATPDDLAAGADGALRAAPAGLTAEGAAAFLATCAQESAYFRTTTEYGSGQRYAPYIGRTFTQITWEANYRDFGRWCKARGLVADADTFVRNPRSLGELRWAWLGPIQYWEENGIWRWANRGQFREVSQAINGGNGRVGTSFTPHGWRERQVMFAAFRAFGDALLPSGTITEEEPDLDPEQNRMLRELYLQLVQGTGEADNPRSWGWPGWSGGTGEHLTLIDMNRRLVVEVRQARNQIAALQNELNTLKGR